MEIRKNCVAVNKGRPPSQPVHRCAASLLTGGYPTLYPRHPHVKSARPSCAQFSGLVSLPSGRMTKGAKFIAGYAHATRQQQNRAAETMGNFMSQVM